MAKKITPTKPPYPINCNYRIKELMHSDCSSTFRVEKLMFLWWIPISDYFCSIEEADAYLIKYKYKKKQRVRYSYRH